MSGASRPVITFMFPPDSVMAAPLANITLPIPALRPRAYTDLVRRQAGQVGKTRTVSSTAARRSGPNALATVPLNEGTHTTTATTTDPVGNVSDPTTVQITVDYEFAALNRVVWLPIVRDRPRSEFEP